ncbi:hypothetical protein ACFSX9_10850 [Flavobacterium ardleyense]|uniref:Uncharacterized protein n=1 Tax=Flavobacterium ardleyense TaxID=2038737 RepID=A0ABW5Z8M0_9FLAO
MKIKESNPIQQRIEQLGEKWEDTKDDTNIKLVRLLYEKNEEEMMDCFFNYMLGVDTDVDDIPVKFETLFTDQASFSTDLVTELAEVIEVWNASNKGEGIEDFKIDFVLDNQYEKHPNKALHFIHNFSNCIDLLGLEEDQYGVAIITDTYSEPSKLKQWLKDALKVIDSKKVRILIAEENSFPIHFDDFDENNKKVVTIVCDLEMDKAIEQVAAMGDPRDPATSFRVEFTKMYQAIEKRKKAETEKHGNNCIGIALKNAEKDPYWITQIVTVYTALSNDQIGHKDFKKAIKFADLAVTAAQKCEGQIDDEISLRLVGQTLLYRGSLFCQEKEWFNASTDFTKSEESYTKCRDVVMGIESCRMAAYAFNKIGYSKEAAGYLTKGFEISEHATPEVVKASSFPLLINALMKTGGVSLSIERIENHLQTIYGDGWKEYIANIYNPELQNNQ